MFQIFFRMGQTGIHTYSLVEPVHNLLRYKRKIRVPGRIKQISTPQKIALFNIYLPLYLHIPLSVTHFFVDFLLHTLVVVVSQFPCSLFCNCFSLYLSLNCCNEILKIRRVESSERDTSSLALDPLCNNLTVDHCNKAFIQMTLAIVLKRIEIMICILCHTLYLVVVMSIVE